MESCKIHRKIRYIVRVARFYKKREDVKTYVGRACKNRGCLRGSAGGKQPKKTDNLHRMFVEFWSKKRSKKRHARERPKSKKKTMRAHGFFAKTAFFWPPNFHWAPRGIPFGPLFFKDVEKKLRVLPRKGVLGAIWGPT